MKTTLTKRTLRRMNSIVSQFKKLEKAERDYVVARLNSDHAKAK